MANPLQHALGVQGLADDRTVDARGCSGFRDCVSVAASICAALLLATLPGCGENRAAAPRSLEDWIAHHQRLEQSVWADEFRARLVFTVSFHAMTRGNEKSVYNDAAAA